MNMIMTMVMVTIMNMIMTMVMVTIMNMMVVTVSIMISPMIILSIMFIIDLDAHDTISIVQIMIDTIIAITMMNETTSTSSS
jgi:hypothetical protein